MRRILYFALLLISALYLSGQTFAPIPVISCGENERVIYDSENGAGFYEDNIYLVCYRVTFVNGNSTGRWEISLEMHQSRDGGSSYTRRVLSEYSGYEKDMYQIEKLEFAPTIYVDEDGAINIIYLDAETTKINLARSTNGGNSFTIAELEGVTAKSQVLPIITETGVYLAGSSTEHERLPLSSMMYVSLYEGSENDEYTDTDHVSFWGRDELSGIVYSNDNIWIQQGGGIGINGFPVFNGPVYCSGIIGDHNTGGPGSYTLPMQDIFLEGYQENCGSISFPSIAGEIRENGYLLEESSEHDILYVQMEGQLALLRYADWITERDTFKVYNSFPDAEHLEFPVGDSIWTNYIDVKELIWSEDTEVLIFDGHSFMVECDLWIEGVVGHNVTFGCADTVYITGDILYEDVIAGDSPDEGDFIFGLVSEERIIIKYKWQDWEGNIHADNCDGIYLYGCYAAIGEGNMDIYGDLNTHYEGCFTYEYQHPHGSTESFELEKMPGLTQYVQYPDFHKYIYPPSPYWSGDSGFQMHSGGPIYTNPFSTCGYPFEDPNYNLPNVHPYGTDLPWYNPVWPEEVNPGMGNRGTIYLYGGVHQYRRGFVHRSGSDCLNHPDEDEWDIEHWNYGGTHGPTGYGKQYNEDVRFNEEFYPIDYPQLVFTSMGHYPMLPHNILKLYSIDLATGEAEEILAYTEGESDIRLLDWCPQGDGFSLLCRGEDCFILDYEDNNFERIEVTDSLRVLDQIESINDEWFVKGQNQLWLINSAGEMEEINSLLPSILQDFTSTTHNLRHAVNPANRAYLIYEESEPGVLEYILGYDLINFDYYEFTEMSYLDCKYNADNVLLQILEEYPAEENMPDFYKSIYLAFDALNLDFLDVLASEVSIIPGLEIYPNPFNPVTNISFSVPEPGLVDIGIYNLKGQKVENLVAENYEPGSYKFVWDASQNSSGLYFVKYKHDSNSRFIKKITLLK
ncbi:MAG: T9SS type A sorting domain-containing protein [Candidatus Cloacimonetes bacterium]|nr:T9SS type A sorting domain-containing protein [Candidatus Cloacimonadota bacterium]